MSAIMNMPTIGSSKIPMLRTALVARNLIASDQSMKDGFARLITKTDITVLNKKRLLKAAEALLEETWDFINESIGAGTWG